ncbi:hypothetical protein MJO28_017090 [Puccinia striiformis f. sp. tritici]|nr:hypothetical protein MJO28_017090 [Puccinia striiformis f. sp. tritici]
MPPKRAAEEVEPIDIDSGSKNEPSVESEDQKKQKTSWIWQYFKPTTFKGAAFNVCQVNKTPGSKDLCLTKLAADRKQSTKSMINHLDRRHRIYKDKCDTGAITKFLEKGKMQKKLNRDSLTAAIARFFIKSNIAFNTGQLVLRDQFRGLKSKISLTCDTWTSPGNNSILGVTAHWIDKDFLLRSIILAARIVEGNHSGVSLANHLLEVLRSFDISNKIFCITADNAANNGTMGAHLSTLIPFDHKTCLLGCMAHVINLAAQAGIKSFSQL